MNIVLLVGVGVGWEDGPIWKLDSGCGVESISCPTEPRARLGGWGHLGEGICGGSGGGTELRGLGLSGPGHNCFTIGLEVNSGSYPSPTPCELMMTT